MTVLALGQYAPARASITHQTCGGEGGFSTPKSIFNACHARIEEEARKVRKHKKASERERERERESERARERERDEERERKGKRGRKKEQ